MSQAGAGTGADDGRGTSPLRWWVLGLSAIAIFSSYYESDAIGPIADLLGRQRGFTQSQIGDLTAVISLPNIPLAVLNGLLIDRYGPARVTLWAALVGFVGAVLTAIGTPYELMWIGRFVFGVSEGAIFISLVAGLAQWFARSGIALATALFLSLARVGSFSLDTSPSWARSLYDAGWQQPLFLGAAITGVGLVAAVVFRLAPRRRHACAAAGSLPAQHPAEREQRRHRDRVVRRACRNRMRRKTGDHHLRTRGHVEALSVDAARFECAVLVVSNPPHVAIGITAQ